MAGKGPAGSTGEAPGQQGRSLGFSWTGAEVAQTGPEQASESRPTPPSRLPTRRWNNMAARGLEAESEPPSGVPPCFGALCFLHLLPSPTF